MKIIKIIFGFLCLFLFLQTVYSIGLFDESREFVFYVSKGDPYINFTVTNPTEPVFVKNITYGRGNVLVINKKVPSGPRRSFSKLISSVNSSIIPLSLGSLGPFKLNILDSYGNELDTEERSTPSEFFVNFDNSTPVLNSPSEDEVVQLTPTDGTVNLEFSKHIQKYEVYIEEKLAYKMSQKSLYKTDYKLENEFGFPLDALSDGVNIVKVDFTDIYGVSSSATFKAVYRTLDINITLLTRKDDNSLKYYFETENSDLFLNKLYYTQDNFAIKVKTNVRALCYFTDNLLGFKPIHKFRNLEEHSMDSSLNMLDHSINVEFSSSSRFWIACQNQAHSIDIAYLSESLYGKQELINTSKYTEGIEIYEILPKDKVSLNPFDIALGTTEQGICFLKTGTQDKIKLNTTNNKNHNKLGLDLNDGTHALNFTCYDKVYNTDSKIHNLIVNSTGNSNVLDWTPKYASLPSTDVSVTLSANHECKYSKTQFDAGEYNNKPALVGDGYIKTFTTSDLVSGENIYYIYCNVEREVSSPNRITITYDSEGLVLSNLTFVNNKIKSDYVKNSSNFEIDFEVKSLIEIDKYYVEIKSENSSEKLDDSTSKPRKITHDLDNAQEIIIIGQNEIGVNSSELRKDILVDSTPPNLEIDKSLGNVSITCVDDLSGCAQIKYSLSGSLDCNPSTIYTGDSIQAGDYLWICYLAEDKVGNEAPSNNYSLGASPPPQPPPPPNEEPPCTEDSESPECTELHSECIEEDSTDSECDFTHPTLVVNTDSQNSSLITIVCTDDLSGCEKIRYSLSDSKDNCTPSIDYISGSSIEVGDNKWICVWAKDGAGNDVYIEEMLEVSSDCEGNLCDFISPTLKINRDPQNPYEVSITCTDDSGECLQIKYSLSNSKESCTESIDYISGSIEVGNNRWICVWAKDGAGNEVRAKEKVSPSPPLPPEPGPSGGGGGGDDDSCQECNSCEDCNPGKIVDGICDATAPAEPSEDECGIFDFEGIDDPEDSGGGGGLIIAAIVLVVLSISGGGAYYAYRKGYLDTQLEKFGIKRSNKVLKPLGKSPVRFTTTGSSNVSQDNKQSVKPKTKYDSHLSKLNKFIDDTLKSGQGVFDKFDKVDKGKVDKYEDTLLKRRKDAKYSQDDFDDFYSKSKASGKSSPKKSLEDEAQDFEKFYKDKKSSIDTKKSNSPSDKNKKK